MGDKIHRLSPRLANQIAAGEVVERPASVVKELLENSVDAGAKRIQIDIELGGLKLIRIRDDGDGISKEDLGLAVSRHATSKIREQKDLQAICSLGFRGEALASISSVSKFSLSSHSNQPGEDKAWQVKTQGNEMKPVIEPASHPLGTTVEVRELFYNIPARRKFLRGERTEFLHIEDVVKRMALSHMDVGFLLRHNQKTIFSIRPAQSDAEYEKRVGQLCGNNFVINATKIDSHAVGMRLWGWVGSPEHTRSQTDCQFFFVNGRMIRDKIILHALRQAYEGYVYEGRHPCYILFLELDPKVVDVNVHPTKHEVRFREARLVHDFILTQVCTVLTGEAQPVLDQDEIYTVNYPKTNLQSQSVLAPEKIPESKNTNFHLLACYDKFILASHNHNGLAIIDVQSASIQINYQRLLDLWKDNQLLPKPLLIPVSISLSQQEVNLLDKHSSLLHRLGLSFAPMGPDSLTVRQAPSILREGNFKGLFLELCNMFKNNFIFSDNTAKKILWAMAQYSLEINNSAYNTKIFRENLIHRLNQLPEPQQNQFCYFLDKTKLENLCQIKPPVFVRQLSGAPADEIES